MSKEKKNLFIFLGACPNILTSWTKKVRSMDKYVLAEAIVASSNNGKYIGYKIYNVKYIGHKICNVKYIGHKKYNVKYIGHKRKKNIHALIIKCVLKPIAPKGPPHQERLEINNKRVFRNSEHM